MASLSAGSSGHVGGALGLSGLVAALAGCTFLQISALGSPEAEAFLPWSLSQVHTAPTPTSPVNDGGSNEIALSGTMPEADRAAPSVSRPPIAVRQDRAEPAVARPVQERPQPQVTRPAQDRAEPQPARPAQVRPEPLAQPAQATTQTRPAAFIVKLRGEPMVDEIISNCRSDRAAADALWQDWSDDDAVFSGMSLQSCSYSGELILGAEIAAGPQGLESGVDALLSRIRNHGSVAYADPDFTAFPGASGE